MRHVDFSPLYPFHRRFRPLVHHCGTRWRSPITARPTRPTTSSARATTPTASPWRWPASPRARSRFEAHRNVLTIKAEKAEEQKSEGEFPLTAGIASRSFERRFQLADHVEVKGAELVHGLLHIDLKRKHPRRDEAAQHRHQTARPAAPSRSKPRPSKACPSSKTDGHAARTARSLKGRTNTRPAPPRGRAFFGIPPGRLTPCPHRFTAKKDRDLRRQ